MGKTERNKKYLRFVSQLNHCWICGDTSFPVDPHHHSIKGVTQKGVGMKVSDYAVVPLCNVHHRQGHHIGWKTFEEKHGANLVRGIAWCLREWIREKERVCDVGPASDFLNLITQVEQL